MRALEDIHNVLCGNDEDTAMEVYAHHATFHETAWGANQYVALLEGVLMAVDGGFALAFLHHQYDI